MSGPNGAGKTTTIRMLLGFLNPSSGSCAVLGGAPRRDVSLRRRIGYLPGDLKIDPTLTGNDLFTWFGGLRGGVDRRRLDQLIERLELDPGRPFGTLSRGNRQKAATEGAELIRINSVGDDLEDLFLSLYDGVRVPSEVSS
jgi:ABC-2 type transport system ATP-binding protein